MGQTNRFVMMLKASWSESIIEVMRLIRAAWGLAEVDGSQYQVRWRDMSDQSMSQIVDALGKASQMLGVPGRGLWSRIPNATAADIQFWESLVDEAELLESDATDIVSASSREASSIGLFNSGVSAGADGSAGGVASS